MDFTTARLNMVDNQLRPNHIVNPLVQQRFMTVARESFAPPAQRTLAYLDAPLSLGGEHDDREMFAPMVAARLVQALDLQPQDTAVVLAGGTGYTASILAGMVANVTVVEDDAPLRQLAQANLAALPNVVFAEGPVTQPRLGGIEPTAILIDAPVQQVPAALRNLLAEGGRLAAVRQKAHGEKTGLLEAVLITRRNKTMFTEVLFETKGRLLPAFSQPVGFEF